MKKQGENVENILAILLTRAQLCARQKEKLLKISYLLLTTLPSPFKTPLSTTYPLTETQG